MFCHWLMNPISIQYLISTSNHLLYPFLCVSLCHTHFRCSIMECRICAHSIHHYHIDVNFDFITHSKYTPSTNSMNVDVNFRWRCDLLVEWRFNFFRLAIIMKYCLSCNKRLMHSFHWTESWSCIHRQHCNGSYYTLSNAYQLFALIQSKKKTCLCVFVYHSLFSFLSLFDSLLFMLQILTYNK